MGVFSKVHRFREAGEAANVRNVERFGEPKRSLFTSSKVMTLHHRIEITDANENVVYRAESKAISLHDKTDLYDARDQHVAHIEKKFFSLHERHFITMADGTAFQLSNELFHLFRDVSNLEGLGWQLKGNILGLNFELYDEKGEIIAVIAQKLFSLHD
ncbi:MAG: LURP-one-related family protein, partial [Clostridia bacterium]|nr:LURP-one-related family protein [Clostridia bacterium]